MIYRIPSYINIKNGEIMDTKIDQLKQIIPEKYILRQEPMKNHTTFRIGGPADIFVAPENMEEIKAVSRFAKEEGLSLIHI
mgnify:FL=1